MTVRERFIKSVIRSSQSETVELPWAQNKVKTSEVEGTDRLQTAKTA